MSLRTFQKFYFAKKYFIFTFLCGLYVRLRRDVVLVLSHGISRHNRIPDGKVRIFRIINIFVHFL